MELEANRMSNAQVDSHDNAVAASSANALTPHSKASLNPEHATAIPNSVIPVNATRIMPVDGVVHLPAGTRLDAIQVSGSNLIVTLPDGQVLLIVDGALHVPQFLIGPIHIPATNIAALIAGQEPEPAAGAPQSSGGNFAETPGDIGDPFGLGNLLPPTEFGFTRVENHQFIPATIDNKPEIRIITIDQPSGSTTATATVSEAALSARGTEPAGSNTASTAETVTGIIQFTSLDQPNTVMVNGTAITAVGQTVATPLGLISITSISPGAIGYSYTLVDNSNNPDATETVTITVRDGDGDVATATLTVAITDDAPIARADTDVVAPNDYTAQSGNVITGIGTISGASGADIQGADGATITGVHSASSNVFTPANSAIAGQYGRLLIHADGSYSYTRSAGTPGGVSDIFTYQLTDKDGDTSTATLTINISDSPVALQLPSQGGDGTFVDEAGLPARGGEAQGSRDGDDSNFTFGVINFEAHDGPAIVTINGVLVTGEGQEIALPTGVFVVSTINPDSLEYIFILTDNVVGAPQSQPIDVTIADQDGDTVSSSFVVDIIDDAPFAVNDLDTVQAGSANGADGNILSGLGGTDANTTDGQTDIQGADGASVTGVSFEGDSGVVDGTTLGAYGTFSLSADGSYLYTLDNDNIEVKGLNGNESLTETFDYTITDGDGDQSSATLIVTIYGQNDVVMISGLNPQGADASVSEANLPGGTMPDSDALTKTGSFTFDAPDGISSIAIGGETLFNGDIVSGLAITSDHGILTITGFDAVLDPSGEIIGGTISYSYELTDHSLLHTGSSDAALTETFAISMIDTDGSIATSSFNVVIADDSPVARADQGDVGEGVTLQADAATGLLANDALGADGAIILGVRALSSDPVGPANGGIGSVITGLYGVLTISEDGSYSYVSNPNMTLPAGAQDVFVYTLRDGDGDTSTTSLTIHLTDSGLTATHLGVQVAEAGLAGASDPGSSNETASGDLSINVSGGAGPLDFALNGNGVGNYGMFTLNGDGTYTYTLTSTVHGTTANNGNNIVPTIETFTYTVTDIFGNTAQNSITIDVIDDVPVARAAPAITVAEDAAAISGNLLANDTLGADGALVTSVTVGGVNVAVSAAGTTNYTNIVGTYTFQANGAWTFDPVSVSSNTAVNAGFTYIITDGDGDQSSAVQLINLTDGTNPRAGAAISLMLDDQNLDSGSTPSLIQPVTADGHILFTPGSDAIASIVFGDTTGLGGGLIWVRESDTQITGWDVDALIVTLDLRVTGMTATVTATLESNFSHHPDTTGDDIADLGYARVVAIDSDGDRAIGTVNLSISDDVPTITALAPGAGLLTVDETNLAVNATADFASLFNVVIGADQPGTVTYAFEVTNASGLVDVATGAKIILQTLGNVVEGRLAGSLSTVAFRLSIAADGHATLDQMRAVQHPDANNPDDTLSLSSTLIRLVATVTDADGDQASATAYVGGALAFKDDGPSIHTAAIDTNTIQLTTQDGDTRGAAFDVATADLSSSFSVASSSYGADGASGTGQILWSYALALGSAAVSTGLTSDGIPVTLALVSGSVIGSAGGTPIFSVAVNSATGLVTLTQFAEIDHPLPGSNGDYAAQIVELAVNLIELRGTATVFDRDGDSMSDMIAVDLGGNIRFADDGPSVSAGGEAPVLVVDETNFYLNATADLSGLFAQTLDFGADDAGNVAYQLGVTSGPSGLIDSLTGEAIILSLVGGVVYGRTSTHEALRITLGSGGMVTFDQSRAILHTPDAGPDQTRYLLGTNLVTLTAIVTDGDGDTARSTADITGHFAIADDAPLAVNDADNVARDGQTFADGNVLTSIGGTDDNGTDGSPDNPGADGGLRVSALAYGATTGTVGSSLAGEFGSLIISADGNYRYALDLADPSVTALNAHQTLTDTFSYTVSDADGDTSTATITITITGANDFPIARADTNWVLDGASGSDPSAVGNVLQNIAHPGAPSGGFADIADNDPNLEAITVTSAGTYTGLYGTLIIGADGAYSYTLNEDNAAVNALDTGQTLLDNFAYTISDGLLSVGSTLSITVFGTNDAPTIGSTIARISEEGLAGGLPDALPDATLDTTNNAVFNGTLAIADLDAGDMLTATLGDPGAVLTAGGLPVIWTGIGTGTLVGTAGSSEVIRVTLAPNGTYSVTLSHSVDHPNISAEDLKEFNVPVSVSDGTVTTLNPAAIHIVIEDDAPMAVGETGSSTQPAQDVNTLFILDFSDSIDGGELNTMLGAVKGALTQLDNAASGSLGIRFVIFSSGSFASPSFTTAAEANLYLDSLNPATGGVRPDDIGLNTNYTGAIQTALANFSAVAGASNQVFFLSDGNPNQQVQFGGFPPMVINSLSSSAATAWNNFVDNNHVNVTAIGIDNNPLQPLNIQRLADVDLNDAPNNHPILVTDFQDLVATLLAVIVPLAISGDLDANDAYGADGGHILSIAVGAITYTWDGASTISVSGGGTIAGHNLNAITTPMGGALTLDFATGHYNYQPPTPIVVTATEVFAYTIIDKDGDTATTALSVTITALAPPVVIDLDGDGVEFVSSAAGVHFDYNGDGVAESTAWVSPDDGLLVIDKNGDGKISNGSELVFAHDGLSDLQGLAATYDSNKDGKLDAGDAGFAKFGIWHDANSNGVTDAGELQSLATSGIASISLVPDGHSYTAADGQVIVRGDAIFTRIDGSTGRLADAAFATNFVNDNQRAAQTAANGLSTALLAAGLVAAVPLSAQAHEALPLVNHTNPEMQVNAVTAMVQPSTFAHAQGPDWLLNHIDTVQKQPANSVAAGHHHFTGHDYQSIEPADGFAKPTSAPAFAGLLEQTDIEVMRHAGQGVASKLPADQAPVIVVLPQSDSDISADHVNAVIADAVEGKTVDLDALLGANIPPEHALPELQLSHNVTGGFGVGDGILPLGNLFMPDMAELHITAQMEHAAATGHV
jgi:large repetitive protein